MIPTKIRVGIAVLALVGCRDRGPKMAQVHDVFPTLPMPPAASVVSREGSPDALKLTLRSTAPPARVEAYYRQTLSKNGCMCNASNVREEQRRRPFLRSASSRPPSGSLR